VDDVNAECAGLARRGELHAFALEEEHAIARPLDATQNLDERGFACAILPDQRMHLGWLDGKVDTDQRSRTRITLADASGGEDGSCDGHLLPDSLTSRRTGTISIAPSSRDADLPVAPANTTVRSLSVSIGSGAITVFSAISLSTLAAAA